MNHSVFFSIAKVIKYFRYRAPELLDLWQNYQIDTRVDLWALGCLLYLLNYGTHPFPDSNKLAIINAKYPLRVEDSFTPIIRELVLDTIDFLVCCSTRKFFVGGLLQPNPDDRMNFDTIFNHLSAVAVTKLEFKKPIPQPIQEPKREEKVSLAPCEVRALAY